MNTLKFLIIHCTATVEGLNVSAKQIVDYHTKPVSQGGRGWSRPGYSELCLLDGTMVNLRPYNEDNLVSPDELTNGAVGYNYVSRHICYVGGLDTNGKPKDTRTAEQKEALADYVKTFHSLHPAAVILGHRDLPGVSKACPSFDVKRWLKEIGIQQ